MATMPSREATFRRALGNILPQVDRLFVFFDKRDSVPAYVANFPKIVPLLPSQYGELCGDGKFLGAQLMAKPCLYFCFDDDILYPKAYVELAALALERHELGAIVGLHATRFKPPYGSYREHRDILHFAQPFKADATVDEIGTGTMSFFTGSFRPDPTGWPHHTMADLMTAIDAVRQRVPRIAIRRPAGFLTPLEEQQEDSLYARLLKDDTLETELMQRALRAYPRAWYCGSMDEKQTLAALESADVQPQ